MDTLVVPFYINALADSSRTRYAQLYNLTAQTQHLIGPLGTNSGDSTLGEAAVSPDGDYVTLVQSVTATAARIQIVRVSDLARYGLSGGTWNGTMAATSLPDGSVIGIMDGYGYLADPATGTYTSLGGLFGVKTLDAAINSNLIGAGGSSVQQLLDRDTFDPVAIEGLEDTLGAVVRLSPGGLYAAFAAGDQIDVVSLWDMKRKVRLTCPVAALEFTYGDSQLLVASSTGLRVFDTATWEQVAEIAGSYSGVCVSKDYQAVYVFDRATRRPAVLDVDAGTITPVAWTTSLSSNIVPSNIRTSRGPHPVLPAPIPSGPFWTLLRQAEQIGYEAAAPVYPITIEAAWGTYGLGYDGRNGVGTISPAGASVYPDGRLLPGQVGEVYALYFWPDAQNVFLEVAGVYADWQEGALLPFAGIEINGVVLPRESMEYGGGGDEFLYFTFPATENPFVEGSNGVRFL